MQKLVIQHGQERELYYIIVSPVQATYIMLLCSIASEFFDSVVQHEHAKQSSNKQG